MKICRTLVWIGSALLIGASCVSAPDSSTHAVFRELIELDNPLNLQYHYLELSRDVRDALGAWMGKEYPETSSIEVVNYGEAFFSAGPRAVIPSFQHQFTANYPSGPLVLLKIPRETIAGLLYLLVLFASDGEDSCAFLAPVEAVYWYSVHEIREGFLHEARVFGDVPCSRLDEVSVAEFEERLILREEPAEAGNAEDRR
ncbi:MAG: hypothetical protein KF911_02220 [Pseudomonadales bacterium]|nr:hypothetical protein [Pseudomonadales bacterium]